MSANNLQMLKRPLPDGYASRRVDRCSSTHVLRFVAMVLIPASSLLWSVIFLSQSLSFSATIGTINQPIEALLRPLIHCLCCIIGTHHTDARFLLAKQQTNRFAHPIGLPSPNPLTIDCPAPPALSDGWLRLT
ncbi:hypothetical protein TSMEX_000823 [Taenia solium]|eukprot:TsM_000994200 transcript=TsM_000994200 gene=TsM_000994200